MSPYLEPGFLATLVLKTSGSSRAWHLIRKFPAPYLLHALHILQIEHLLFKAQLSEPSAPAGQQGKRDWDHHFAEGVFQLVTVDWDSGLRLAIGMNRQAPNPKFTPMMFLHAGLAVAGGATHYCSFHPQFRAVAAAANLRVLPERL